MSTRPPAAAISDPDILVCAQCHRSLLVSVASGHRQRCQRAVAMAVARAQAAKASTNIAAFNRPSSSMVTAMEVPANAIPAAAEPMLDRNDNNDALSATMDDLLGDLDFDLPMTAEGAVVVGSNGHGNGMGVNGNATPFPAPSHLPTTATVQAVAKMTLAPARKRKPASRQNTSESDAQHQLPPSKRSRTATIDGSSSAQDAAAATETSGNHGRNTRGGKIPPPYDPDKHCGVVDPPGTEPCRRVLTCKKHPILMRRAVTGRSQDLSVLLELLRGSQLASKQQHELATSAAAAMGTSSSTTPMHRPLPRVDHETEAVHLLEAVKRLAPARSIAAPTPDWRQDRSHCAALHQVRAALQAAGYLGWPAAASAASSSAS
ncbi:SCA7, zinc-binding domain-containing protein [Blastocladiella britannica]|nr:SCA7, zinc-binding domain-containing protein [Blastocladiella britannica]